MNKLLQTKLYQDFPSLYSQASLPMSQTCMCWGFECGDGWSDLIRDLSVRLVDLDPTIQAVQVKEKFGTLRFYTTSGGDEVYDAIQVAEQLSAQTCEVCGEAGNLYGPRWLSTRCLTHAPKGGDLL